MASFFVIRGQDHGRNYIIRGEVTSIGRDSQNQIRLNDTEVSRQHAIITRIEDNKFELKDCGSSNGSYVNSQQVEAVVLQSGDRVQLGRTLMIFAAGPENQTDRTEVQRSDQDDQVQIVARETDELAQIRSRADSRMLSHHGLLQPSSASGVSDRGNLSTDAFFLEGSAADFADEDIVYQVSQAIRRTIDVPELLGKVLDLIFHWIRCDRGCILVQDEVTGGLRPACTRHRRQSKSSAHRPLQISRSILDHVILSHEGVLTSNAQEDDRWEQAASIAGLGIREVICVPMQGRYGMQGAIYVDTEMSAGRYLQLGSQSTFDHRHLKLMIAIGGQAALALEDTQYYTAMLQSERLAAMGQTIADLSHHVKNILQGISGGSFLVEDGLARQEFSVVQRGWDIVRKNQERISNLVMDMLSFSKEREPDMQPADINPLVSEVVELLQNKAAEAGVRLSVHTLARPTRVLMDCDGIRHALLNVIHNGIDAAAAAERAMEDVPFVSVTMELCQDLHLISIHVQDNGDGIATENLVRIFAPFHSSKGSRGTGLGLPVSQKILREHGGDLLVSSECNVGSTFTLQWPIGISDNLPTRTG